MVCLSRIRTACEQMSNPAGGRSAVPSPLTALYKSPQSQAEVVHCRSVKEHTTKLCDTRVLMIPHLVVDGTLQE
jgi:hypothetical protein